MTNDDKIQFLRDMLPSIEDGSYILDTSDYSPRLIENVLEEYGYHTPNVDKNGWQVDFWITHINPRKKIALVHSGCWYEGESTLGLEK